jgi:hypothetical protein
MIGNEISLLPAFINHAESLFDSHSFVVHNALDGSFEKLVDRFPNSVSYLNSDGYPQSTVMTKLMTDAFESGVDVVIPLDADEFLPFSRKERLDEYIRSNDSVDVLELPWRNFSVKSFPLDKDMMNLVYSHDFSKVYKSVIFKSAFLKDPMISLTQGNHSLISRKNLNIKRETKVFIIHVPIRDPLHYAQKNIHGASTYLHESSHDLSDDWVNGALEAFPGVDYLISKSLDYGDANCNKDHNSLKQIEFFSWMKNGFDEDKQKDSFLAVMNADWNKLRKMYSNSNYDETSSLEMKILKHRLMKYEKSLSFRVFRRIERILMKRIMFTRRIKNE